MHECEVCGMECDCDMEDHGQPAPDDCSCDHEGGDPGDLMGDIGYEDE